MTICCRGGISLSYPRSWSKSELHLVAPNSPNQDQATRAQSSRNEQQQLTVTNTKEHQQTRTNDQWHPTKPSLPQKVPEILIINIGVLTDNLPPNLTRDCEIFYCAAESCAAAFASSGLSTSTAFPAHSATQSHLSAKKLAKISKSSIMSAYVNHYCSNKTQTKWATGQLALPQYGICKLCELLSLCLECLTCLHPQEITRTLQIKQRSSLRWTGRARLY